MLPNVNLYCFYFAGLPSLGRMESWPLSAASWEPENNVTDDCVESFCCPTIDAVRRLAEVDHLYQSLQKTYSQSVGAASSF